MILGYIGPNFGGNKNLFNPKNTIVLLKQILTWLGQSEVTMNGGYPFGERVDDDFAISG